MRLQADFSETRNRWKLDDRRITGEFIDMTLGISFGDPTVQSKRHHSVCVSGMREDKVAFILAGFSGYFDEMAQKAIEYKDVFKVQHGYIPSGPQKLISDLRQIEGLTYYKKERDPWLGYKYVTPTDTWDTFVNHDTKMVLVPVLPQIEKEFDSQLVDFEAKIDAGKIQVPKTTWPDLIKTLVRPPRETLDDSILRAAVYSIAPMFMTPERHYQRNKYQPRYKNMPRTRRTYV